MGLKQILVHHLIIFDNEQWLSLNWAMLFFSFFGWLWWDLGVEAEVLHLLGYH
jgi:hypothetical protein